MTVMEFVEKYGYHQQFEALKKDWSQVRKDIDDERLILDELECVNIQLNDLEDENTKCDIFCITDDKMMPGFGLFLVMNTLRKKTNEFLAQIEKNPSFQ